MNTVEITIKLRATIGMKLDAENQLSIIEQIQAMPQWQEPLRIDVGEDLEDMEYDIASIRFTQRPSRRRAKRKGGPQ